MRKGKEVIRFGYFRWNDYYIVKDRVELILKRQYLKLIVFSLLLFFSTKYGWLLLSSLLAFAKTQYGFEKYIFYSLIFLFFLVPVQLYFYFLRTTILLLGFRQRNFDRFRKIYWAGLWEGGNVLNLKDLRCISVDRSKKVLKVFSPGGNRGLARGYYIKPVFWDKKEEFHSLLDYNILTRTVKTCDVTLIFNDRKILITRSSSKSYVFLLAAELAMFLNVRICTTEEFKYELEKMIREYYGIGRGESPVTISTGLY